MSGCMELASRGRQRYLTGLAWGGFTPRHWCGWSVRDGWIDISDEFDFEVKRVTLVTELVT